MIPSILSSSSPGYQSNPSVQSSSYGMQMPALWSMQYKTEDNLKMRQLFNSLPKEVKTDNFALIGQFIENSDFLNIPGKTLELGGGNALFWKIASQTLSKLITKGDLHVTDVSEGMVKACQSAEVLKRENIFIEQMDATNLSSYQDSSFGRIIANFMMYELKTEEKIHQALNETVRVLSQEGQAIYVTMDEKIHMRQIYSTLQQAKDLLAEEGVFIATEFPQYAPAILPFCGGNAQEYLSEYFNTVEITSYDNAILVHQNPNSDITGPDFIVKYLQSLEFVQKGMENEQLPEIFFEKIRNIVQQTIDQEGVFRITRRELIYYCSNPIEQTSTLMDNSLKA